MLIESWPVLLTHYLTTSVPFSIAYSGLKISAIAPCHVALLQTHCYQHSSTGLECSNDSGLPALRNEDLSGRQPAAPDRLETSLAQQCRAGCA